MSKSKSLNRNMLDSNEKPNTPKNERSHTLKQDGNNALPQKSSTIWKNISKLFNKNKARQKVPVVNVAKGKECSVHRLSSFLQSKKLSQNSLVPLTTIGESPTGYQAAFTQKANDASKEEVTVMTIKLPDGITTDNVDVTLELSVIRSNTKNIKTSATQEPMTMYCTEENDAQTIFTGILKVPNETEIINLLNMPLYLIDSSENVVLNGSKVSHRKIVRTSKEISHGNPFQEIEVDDIKVKLTFDRISNTSNSKKFSSSTFSEVNESDSVDVAEESDEMVITVNSYNVSEISSILKGKPLSNDEMKLIKDGPLETSNMRRLVESAIIHIVEPKEKTEDISVLPRLNESIKSLNPQGATLERSKKSVPVLNKEPKPERTKEMSTQYSHSYFTSNKETNTELLRKELSLHLIEPQPQNVYVTESIEIKDFTYFDQNLEEDMLARNSRSTATPWFSPDYATISESATLLSSISDCGYNIKNEFENNDDCNTPKSFSSVDVVLNAREELLENAVLCITLKEPITNNFEASETVDNFSVTSLKDLELNNEDSLILSFRSDTDVEKEGKTEDFSTNGHFNQMSIKSVDKIFDYLEGNFCKTKHESFEDRYVNAFKPEETRKIDIRLGKNPFYFPEKELDKKEDGNKRYYEDNDEFYEKHREGIQNFFQDCELTSENFQLTKSKKNYDLYLRGDSVTGALTSRYVSVEDLERIIAVHDEVGVHSEMYAKRVLPAFNNFEISANFVYDGESSKLPATTSTTDVNKEKVNNSNKCDEKDVIVKHKCQLREFKSSSNSIVFKIDGEVQLKTEESCNSCFSKRTIMLDGRESTVRIQDSEKVECSQNAKQFESKQIPSVWSSNSIHDADSTLNNSSTIQINQDLIDLDQNNSKIKNKRVYAHIAYCSLSDGRQNPRNYITKLNQHPICAQIAKPLSSLETNLTNTDNTLRLNIENIIGKSNLVTGIKHDHVIRAPVEEKQSLNLTSIYLKNSKNAQICIPFLYKQIKKCATIEPTSRSRVNFNINKYSINSSQVYNNEIYDVPIDSNVNDLRDCFMKMNEILIAGASMSLDNTESNIIANTFNHEKNNVDLSQERLKTYEKVENDIKKVIQELLQESKDIKESAILKGVIEEFEPPFTVDYIKKEPIDYTKLCLVMVDEIGNIKHKSRTVKKDTTFKKIELKENEETQNIDKVSLEETNNEVVHQGIKLPGVEIQKIYDKKELEIKHNLNYVKETTKPTDEKEVAEGIEKDIRSLIGFLIDEIANEYTCNNEQQLPERNTRCTIKKYSNCSNFFDTNQKNINNQMTYFCNSDPFHSKIPKTCHSFGKLVDSLSDNNDEMCPNNSIKFIKNKNVAYAKNKTNSNFINNLINTDFKSEHSFAEDDKRSTVISENIGSIFPNVASYQGNIIENQDVENIEYLKVLELSKPPEIVMKLKTVLSTTYEEDCSPESPGKDVSKCKKNIKLSNANNMQNANDNMPSTSTPYIHRKSTEDEEFLNDMDLTNPAGFSTEEEEEEILLSPKLKESSSRIFMKNGIFTSSSSDEEVLEFHTKPSKVYPIKEQHRQKANFNNDQSQESLQVKPPIFNLHEKLEAESSNSIYNISNLRIRRSSNASDADDENENPRINFTLPKNRYKSKLELNSAQELADIEKNLQDNDVIIKKRLIIVPPKNNMLTRIVSDSNTSSSDSTTTNEEEEIQTNPSEPIGTPQVR